MTKAIKIWLLATAIAIALLSWRSHLLHNLLIEQHKIAKIMTDTLNLHTERLELLGDRTGRTQDLAICNSLALREAAADLTGASNRASGWFQGCAENQ